jgi:hypothetical protein
MVKEWRLSNVLEECWVKVNGGESPVEEAERAICSRRMLILTGCLVVLAIFVSVVCAYFGLIDRSSLLIPGLLLCVIAAALFGLSDTGAREADEFLEKHDRVLRELVGVLPTDDLGLLEQTAREVLEDQWAMTNDAVSEGKGKKEIEDMYSELRSLLKLFQDFGLVGPNWWRQHYEDDPMAPAEEIGVV